MEYDQLMTNLRDLFEKPVNSLFDLQRGLARDISNVCERLARLEEGKSSTGEAIDALRVDMRQELDAIRTEIRAIKQARREINLKAWGWIIVLVIGILVAVFKDYIK